MPSSIVVEGDTDFAILNALDPSLPVVKPERPAGRDSAIKRAALAAMRVGIQDIILVLDRNGHSPDELLAEVGHGLASVWAGEPVLADGWFAKGKSRVKLVPAGLPEEPTLADFGLSKWTTDDYLLALCLNSEALSEFYSGERRLLFTPPAEELKTILLDLARSLRARGALVVGTKQLILLTAALMGFQATRATFAEKLVKRGAPAARDLRERIFGQLLREVRSAPAVS